MRHPMCAGCSRSTEHWVSAPSFVCQECAALLCLNCFVANKTVSEHRTNHRYQIRSANRPLVADAWVAADDLRLFDAVAAAGLGNWTDIAKKIGRSHSASDVRRHYLERHCARARKRIQMDLFDVGEDSAYCGAERIEAMMTDHELDAPQDLLPGAALNGYMPLRGDFDVEYDDDAEILVSDLELRTEENAADRTLKQRVLQIYHCKLQERDCRKRFVIGRGLLDTHRQHEESRKRPRYGGNGASNICVFARFQTPENAGDFVGGLLETDRLRKRLAKLSTPRATRVDRRVYVP